MLCSDGACKVFDKDANGYVRSETIGAVFLQKSKDAKRIYGQVINSFRLYLVIFIIHYQAVYGKINCDGYKSEGLNFPSTTMQAQLLKEVYEDSGLDLDDLSYIEAHGTGTIVGDSQEVEAIDTSVGKKRTKPLLIGSVKSNLGHTEPSAGICSLAKVRLFDSM